MVRGHARKLTSEEAAVQTNKQCFLKHHAVLNSNKPGKVRMVMDAKIKYNSVSLNNELFVRSDLRNNLSGVLFRFRENRVALPADIEDTFHQCLVIERDQPFLGFLRRDLGTRRAP